jgi:hypothetical protein
MQRRIRVILEYLLAFVLIVFLLLAIFGVVVVKFHGDDLQAFVMEQVNEHLDTKVHVEEISVRVFHKFPSTSIVLQHVTVWSSHNFSDLEFEEMGADTLLTAERVNVSFHLFGIIRKRFNIRQVEIQQGSLRLFTDSAGEGNYRFFGEKEASKKGKGFIDIFQLKIKDFTWDLDNRAKELKASGWLEFLELNGRFSKRNTQVRGTLKGSLEEISNKGIRYASDRSVSAKLNMDVRDSVYSLRTGQLQLDRVTAAMEGSLLLKTDRSVEMDLEATAKDLEIHEVLDLLPSDLVKSLTGLRGNGILQVNAHVTGIASSTLTPHIEADFETRNANLSWRKIPFSLQQLNLTGSYSNGGEFNPVTTRLDIESINAVIGSDHLSGRVRIQNFLEPDFAFELKGDIHPEQWTEWYPSAPIGHASGTLIPNMSVSGSFDRLKPKGEKFVSFDLNGELALEDVTFTFLSADVPFHKVNGSVRIENDFWEPSLSGSFGKSDFHIEGSGLNLISFLLGGQDELIASATFRSDHFDLGEVLGQLPRKETGGERSLRFPDGLDLRMEFIIHDFIKELFEAQNVRGTARFDSPFLFVDSLTMQTMDGTVRGSFGMVQDTEGDIFTSVDASLYSLDIQSLFKAFNNFGQEQLTHEHLKGSISGTSVFSAEFDPSFFIRPATILSENDISIRDGELNNFTPMLALSRFIEVEELENIRFNTLENTILIKDSQVIIPSMDIKSNALNLSASGTHNFNNHYDYRLQLKLSELLYNKARRSGNSEFTEAEDLSDTRTLFIKIHDEGAGASVEMDREQTARKIREDLRNEGSELKKILNEELGLFRQEEIQEPTVETGEAREENFRFEFDEEGDTGRTETRQRGRRFRKRTNADSLENKPALEFVIDE